jgi:hypothetical protein
MISLLQLIQHLGADLVGIPGREDKQDITGVEISKKIIAYIG